MSEWFHVGQKVVCVDDDFDVDIGPGKGIVEPVYPVKDGIYEVSDIRTLRAGDFGLREDSCFIKLAGIADHQWYDADCFRPFRKRRTDISIFKTALEPSGQKEDA